MKQWLTRLFKILSLGPLLFLPACSTVQGGENSCLVYKRTDGSVGTITKTFKAQLFSNYVYIRTRLKNEDTFLFIPRESLYFIGDGGLCGLESNGSTKDFKDRPSL